MKKYIVLLICWALLGTNSLHAQVSAGGVPLGMQDANVMQLLESAAVTTLALPSLDNNSERINADAILNAECTDCRKQYYGTGIDVTLDLIQSGSLHTLADGSIVRLVRIQSPTAYGLQFYFSEFDIPYGARLFVYNEDRSAVLGAYTSANNPVGITSQLKFALEYLEGNSIILEYYEPEWADYSGTLTVGKVVHVFRDLFSREAPQYGTADPCHVNVACTTHTADWKEEASSVALVQKFDFHNNLAGHCSGALVNTTNLSGDPYFLTASHCAGSETPDYAFDLWVFKFQHQTNRCNPAEGFNYRYRGLSISGSKKIAREHSGGPQSDYLLLRLNTKQKTLESHGICYSGWIGTSSHDGEVSQAVGIHHPEADVKKFSRTDVETASTEYLGTGNWHENDHIRIVDWSLGVTAKGSSGSPLYNSSRRIIGQLHGGRSECVGVDGDNGESDWYGKMFENFKDQAFKDALAPNNTLITEVATFCPAPAAGLADNECVTELNDGMSLNGNKNLSSVPCVPSSTIVLGPIGPCEVAKWKWKGIVEEWRCSKIPDHIEDVALVLPNPPLNWKCRVFYDKFHVQLVETDVNKNVVGTPSAAWIFVSKIEEDEIVIDNNIWAELGVTLEYGKYYRVRITVNNGGEQKATRYFRYLPVDIVESGTIDHDVVAQQTITLNNATVTQNIDVVAGQTIYVFESSFLQAGTYKIEPQPFCDLQRSGLPISEEQPIREEAPQEFIPGSDPYVNVYPNPSSGRISVDATGFGTSVNVELVNSLGQVLLQLQDARAITDIDLSSLPDGMYILRLNNGSTTLSRKVIKQ